MCKTEEPLNTDLHLVINTIKKFVHLPSSANGTFSVLLCVIRGSIRTHIIL